MQHATINRHLAPTSYPIQPIEFIAPVENQYENGLKTFIFNGGDQDVVRMEWIFDSVFRPEDQENALLHSCVSSMMLEGTHTLTNAEISELVDFHGAFLIPEFSTDHTTITLFSLNKHLSALFPIIHSLFTSASFPEKEWEIYLRNRKQRLEISLRKNDVLARRTFNHKLFAGTRYGTLTEPEDLDGLSRTLALEQYRREITPNNCQLFIAGQIKEETTQLIEEYFVKKWPKVAENLTSLVPNFQAVPGELTVQTIPDALQSAIRMGIPTIKRNHPDFPGLQFVNTLLGGYFGSRLMANIREDKGFTYGIGAGIADMKHTAYFTIATEVGVDVTHATLVEIEKEINLLRNELVGEDELNLVRNYLMGSLLGSLENIFSHADKFKQAYFSNLDLNYFKYYQDQILAIDAGRVQELANTYLDYDKMEKVVVGKI
jgi:zinc protease